MSEKLDVYGGVAPTLTPAWAADGRTRPLSQRKGLTNDAGENNCFLNVIIQSLWHVRSCRVLISMGDHAVHHRCGGDVRSASSIEDREACLLCELEQIFILYQFSEQPVLEVDRVRMALGDMFALGAMNDATETLEAILDALHFDTFNRMLLMRRGVTLHHQIGGFGVNDADLTQSVRADAAAIVCEPQCVAHLLFQMNLMELRSCTHCSSTNDPLMNSDFLYRVYAQEMLMQVKELSKASGKKPTLEHVLCREAQGVNDGVTGGSCDECKRSGTMKMSRWILTLPMVFAVSIIWSSDQVNKAEVKDWMDLLSTQHKGGDEAQTQRLDLGNIFRLDNSSGVSSEYAFRGMVCYYGRHYVGFFASRSMEDGEAKERWFLFDDTRVKRVGTWADVRLRIERGGYQPTLLFYERTGIELGKLEQTASEIHKWWEKSAEEKVPSSDTATEATNEAVVGEEAVLVSTEDSAEGTSHAVPSKEQSVNDLVEALKQSMRLTPHLPYEKPAPTVILPTSPIRVPKGPSTALPSTQASGWHDEHIYRANLEAQSTLSRLDGILSKDRAPATIQPDGREMLRMAMSMSMRQSVRRRDYSVHRLTDEQLDVNRDAIFMDIADTPSAPVPKSAPVKNTNGDINGNSAAGIAAVQRTSPHKPPRHAINSPATSTKSGGLKVFDVELRASDGGIGLELEESGQKSMKTFTVSKFEVNGAGEKLPAEASGAIEIGDMLIGINGHSIESDELLHVLELLLTATSPVRLTFHRHERWPCPRCTLLNDMKEAQCAACGHEI